MILQYENTKGRWPYKLTNSYIHDLMRQWPPIQHKMFFIDGQQLIIHAGYAWDGVSCFPDRKEWLLASLVHDCLIQACDEGLCKDKLRDQAHIEMKYIVRKYSNSVWASVMYVGLRWFHRTYVNIKKILE